LIGSWRERGNPHSSRSETTFGPFASDLARVREYFRLLDRDKELDALLAGAGEG
jgi:hypothetical protein